MSKLSIVATPIGNLDDITVRAIKTLFTADVILCEDTRHTGMLLAELVKRWGEQFDQNPDWKPNLFRYHDQIEEKKLPEIIDMLMRGNHIALVSDAGTPLISDPGFRLVRECRKRTIAVESIPGPSAVLAALTSSGIPTDSFYFMGYPPEKQSARLKFFSQLPTDTTIIFYCAPHKLMQTLLDLKTSTGDIEISVARELTKIHEETWTGTITRTMERFINPKGEFVILLRTDEKTKAEVQEHHV